MMRGKCSSAFAGRTEAFYEAFIADGVMTIVLQVYHLTKIICKYRFTVRCQGHHFIFIRRVQEAKVAGYLFVQQSQRMRHVHLCNALHIVTSTHTESGGSFLTAPVTSQYGGLFIRRRQKCTGRMREVMFYKMKFFFIKLSAFKTLL